MAVHLSFDRGTLRVDVPFGVDLPSVRWDDRTECGRAPASAYRAIRAWLKNTSLDVQDEVLPRLAKRVQLESPSLRSYQEEALAAWAGADHRGLVVMPTGSGKTRVAIAAAARVGLPTLILCPTRVLLAQWAHELRRAGISPVGVLGDGELDVQLVTVATFESAYQHLDTWGDLFALLIVDEAHHFGSGARSEALEMAVAPLRLGLTATPPPVDALERLEASIGPVVFEVQLGDLLGSHLAELEVVALSVALDEDEREAYDAAYRRYAAAAAAARRGHPRVTSSELAALLRRTREGRDALRARQRAEAIASLPRQKQKLVSELVGRHSADHLLVFAATARDAREIAERELIPLITAEISRSERNEILERFREGTYRAIASARVLNEGVDVPDASVAVIAGGVLGRREHVQRVGRVLRPQPGKRARVYELITRNTLEERRRVARRIHEA